MKMIQERREGEVIRQGLSVTRLESGYRRYILRVADVKVCLSFPSAGGVIFGVDTVTLKDPEYPGARINRRLLEIAL